MTLEENGTGRRSQGATPDETTVEVFGVLGTAYREMWRLVQIPTEQDESPDLLNRWLHRAVDFQFKFVQNAPHVHVDV
jgi:hypothetical protein